MAPSHAALDLFSAEDLALGLVAKVTARARELVPACSRGTREEDWAYALRMAVTEISKQQHAPSIVALVNEAQRLAEDARATIRVLCMDDDELTRSLRSTRRYLALDDNDVTDPEEQDANADEDDSDADDYDEDDYEAEESYDAQAVEIEDETESGDDTLVVARNSSLEHTLAQFTAERELRESPGFDRLAHLHDFFTQRYGEASEALCDLFVAIKLADLEWDSPIAVNGIIVNLPHDRLDYERVFEGDDEARDSIIDAIAQERRRRNLGAPDGYAVTVPTLNEQIMPRIGNTPYHRCPCCNALWSPTHRCKHHGRHAASHRVLDERGFRVTDECAFERRNGAPLVDMSAMGRGKRFLVFVSPRYGNLRLEANAARQFANPTLRVRVCGDRMTFTEDLPDLPNEGTALTDFLEVASATRKMHQGWCSLDQWWMHKHRERTSKAFSHQVVYATATDTIVYRARARTVPAILPRSYSGPDNRVGAIVGDRIGSAYGPIVEAVLTHDSKKDAEATAVADNLELTKAVLDGTQWKTIHLAVPPIDSYDEATLQDAVLRELEDHQEHPRALSSTTLIRERGLLHAYKIAYNQQADEERALGPAYYFDRFEKGYEDAISHLVSVFQHYLACSDCGVLEFYHRAGPIPCGEKRESWNIDAAGTSKAKDRKLSDAAQTALF